MPSSPMVESDCWALAFIFALTTNASHKTPYWFSIKIFYLGFLLFMA